MSHVSFLIEDFAKDLQCRRRTQAAGRWWYEVNTWASSHLSGSFGGSPVNRPAAEALWLPAIRVVWNTAKTSRLYSAATTGPPQKRISDLELLANNLNSTEWTMSDEGDGQKQLQSLSDAYQKIQSGTFSVFVKQKPTLPHI